MKEVIWSDISKNRIVIDGEQIFFAHGDDPGGFQGVSTFLHLLLFAFVLSFLQFLAKKYFFLSETYQFPVIFVVSIFLTVGSFFFLNKKFVSEKVNVPIEQRKNVITIDMFSKQVTWKEKYRIIDNFTLPQEDYFWFPEQLSRIKSYRGTITYVISLVHKNQQTVVATTGSFDEIHRLYKKLNELGFNVKKDN